MTHDHPSESDLELRLRRLYGGLDTTATFTPALRARIEGLRTVEDELARRERRLRADRDRLETEARLRRAFRTRVVLTLGGGALAALAAWFFGAPIGAALAAVGRGPGSGWNPLVLASVALLVGWLCLVVRGASRGDLGRLALG